jgi:hypothetical protein
MRRQKIYEKNKREIPPQPCVPEPSGRGALFFSAALCRPYFYNIRRQMRRQMRLESIGITGFTKPYSRYIKYGGKRRAARPAPRH